MAETLRELVVALSLDSSNFSRNMRTINQQIKEAESTFRLAGAGVENYEKTIAGTESKLSMLGQKLTQQQRAVVQYSRALVAANDKLKEKGEKELPIPILNVTGIPMRQKINDALKDVIKIRELTLRFYPLNGDINYAGLLDGVATDLRRKVGCKRGEIVLKSPRNVSGVIDVVSSSEGTVDAIFSVTYNDKRKGKIKNDEISENLELDIVGNNTDEEINNAIEQGGKISSLQYTSDENSRIYEKNKSNIIPFVSKK